MLQAVRVNANEYMLGKSSCKMKTFALSSTFLIVVLYVYAV